MPLCSTTQLFAPFTAPREELCTIALKSLAGMVPEYSPAFEADFRVTMPKLTDGMSLEDLKTSVHVAVARA